MDYPIIAIVHIEFLEGMLKDQDIQAIESLLRNKQDIYHLLVRERIITFYIWGKEKINYSILDEIKKELENKQYPHFAVTADEYVKTKEVSLPETPAPIN